MRNRIMSAVVFFLFGMALGLALSALDRPECSGERQPSWCAD